MTNEERTAPGPVPVVGPYSSSVTAGHLVFCSGQLPIHPVTGELVGDSVADQTRQVVGNVREVLRAAHCDLSDIVKTTVFLRTLDDFPEMNEAYAECLGDARPARSTIGGLDLPRGARIEIEAIAVSRSTASGDGVVVGFVGADR